MTCQCSGSRGTGWAGRRRGPARLPRHRFLLGVLLAGFVVDVADRVGGAQFAGLARAGDFGAAGGDGQARHVAAVLRGEGQLAGLGDAGHDVAVGAGGAVVVAGENAAQVGPDLVLELVARAGIEDEQGVAFEAGAVVKALGRHGQQQLAFRGAVVERLAASVDGFGPFVGAEHADGVLHAAELPGAFGGGAGQGEGGLGQVDLGLGAGFVFAGLAVFFAGVPGEAGEVLRAVQFEGVAEPVGRDAAVGDFVRVGALAVDLVDGVHHRGGIGRGDGGGLGGGGLGGGRLGGVGRQDARAGERGQRGGKQAGERGAQQRAGGRADVQTRFHVGLVLIGLR